MRRREKKNQIPSLNQIVRPPKLQKGINRITPKDPNKKVVAVIVTFSAGGSYDNLFTTTQQKSEEGTQVSVFSVASSEIRNLLSAFKNNESQNETIRQIMDDIKVVDTDCVVFNWQCCGSYANKSFPEDGKIVMEFAKMMIDRGHMTMFSDFSLKALISEWNPQFLGPKPFKQIKQFGGQTTLHFNCQTLKQSPSAQLQIVGEMATSGHCNIQAAGGTIVYTLNQNSKIPNQFYELQILSVVSSLKEFDKTCKIEENEGPAGHVVLRYKSGGCLLTSMGHWVQLMKIDTSEKVLFDLAEQQYGIKEATRMRKEYENLDTSKQKEYISRNAVEFVQRQAPCSNMSRKARSKY